MWHIHLCGCFIRTRGAFFLFVLGTNQKRGQSLLATAERHISLFANCANVLISVKIT